MSYFKLNKSSLDYKSGARFGDNHGRTFTSRKRWKGTKRYFYFNNRRWRKQFGYDEYDGI